MIADFIFKDIFLRTSGIHDKMHRSKNCRTNFPLLKYIYKFMHILKIDKVMRENIQKAILKKIIINTSSQTLKFITL